MTEDHDPSIIQVQTTTASEEAAGDIARHLVGHRLAACAQVSGPISSTYWWEGEVQSATEWVCTAKTTAAALDEVIAAIRNLHSYDEPEIIATEVTAGSSTYLAWVAGEVGGHRR